MGLVYVESYIKLLEPIRPKVVIGKKQRWHDMTNLIGVVYAEKKTKLSWEIKSGANNDENKIG